MDWTRSDTLSLADARCGECLGVGLIRTRTGVDPCACVTKAIFRICLARYRECADRTIVQTSRAERVQGRGFGYGRANEEYMADFCLTAKRVLTPELQRVFRMYFIARELSAVCMQKMSLGRMAFYRRAWAVEEKLGRAFRETQPYGLFPLDQYFSAVRKG